MDEVEGPIYGYRVYGTISPGFGPRRVLVPVHVRYINANGQATSWLQESFLPLTPPQQEITVDLFDWHVATHVPEIESDHHAWVELDDVSIRVMSDISEWAPLADIPQYVSAEEGLALRQQAYYGLRTGIHSFKELRHAVEYSRLFRDSWNKATSPPVLAKIEVGGVVVEHENGYRSEKSRIVDLMMFAHEKARHSMAECLGWPFEIEVPEENA